MVRLNSVCCTQTLGMVLVHLLRLRWETPHPPTTYCTVLFNIKARSGTITIPFPAEQPPTQKKEKKEAALGFKQVESGGESNPAGGFSGTFFF